MLYVVCRELAFDLSLSHPLSLSLSVSYARSSHSGPRVPCVACCVLRVTCYPTSRGADRGRLEDLCVSECECVFGVFVVLCVVDCSGWWGILFESFVASLTKEAWYGSVEQ